ncbi:MAG: hypothetical protein V4792_10005 [Pseudomonadota bacterium]
MASWDNDPIVQPAAKQPAWMADPVEGGAPQAAPKGFVDQAVDGTLAGIKRSPLTKLAMGGLAGAADIGATLQHALNPMEWGRPAPTLSGVVTGKQEPNADEARRASLADFFKENSDPDSLFFQGGRLGTQVAGTGGVGRALGLGAKAIGAGAPAVNALGSAGFTTGARAAPGAGNLLANVGGRAAAGGAVGGVSAGLIDPSTADEGALIGAALPPAIKAAGALGSATGKAFVGSIAPEVQALAKRAKELGITIPGDRIANSKPLNAVASSLNYVPFSGRAAVETRMQDQLNTALSKTFGQDSPNVTMALRKAQGDLGAKFDAVLRGNSVTVDQQFLTDLADASNKASRELGSDGASIISKQVDDIVAKAGSGQIDGQAAYNIKRTLDRIGERNSPEAFYARELKKSLMGALDRSLGPVEAKAFAKTRKEYGNMLSLENLAQNGAEGDISIARLANMKNIGNADLQELADISAQFLKPREGQHGAMQRVFGLGGVGALGGGLPGAATALGAGALVGRTTNAALDSNVLRNLLTTSPGTQNALQVLAEKSGAPLSRAAPVALSRDR